MHELCADIRIGFQGSAAPEARNRPNQQDSPLGAPMPPGDLLASLSSRGLFCCLVSLSSPEAWLL